MKNAVAILGGIATILAALAAIFPDTFTIRGTPQLSALLGLTLPLAVGCTLVYLLILDRRVRRLLLDQKALAAEQARIRLAAVPDPPHVAFARSVVGNPPPSN